MCFSTLCYFGFIYSCSYVIILSKNTLWNNKADFILKINTFFFLRNIYIYNLYVFRNFEKDFKEMRERNGETNKISLSNISVTLQQYCIN